MKVSGIINGTGSAMYVSLGFIPDFVRLVNIESATLEEIQWSKNMRSAESEGGIKIVAAGTRSRLTNGAGLAIYRGGDKLSAASTAYVEKDENRDKRGNVKSWTLDTAGNRTGKFNAAVDTAYVGEGSEVLIKETVSGKQKRVFISAISSTGDENNEVTLSEAVKGGEVLFTGPMYDYKGCAAGTVTKPGFVINEATNINASGEMMMFEAGVYED